MIFSLQGAVKRNMKSTITVHSDGS